MAAANAPPGPEDSLPCQLMPVANLPVQEVHKKLLVQAQVNDQPVTLVFDTGADETILTPDAAKRLGLHWTNMPSDTIQGIGGERKVATYRSNSIKVGTLHGESWQFLVADVDSGPMKLAVDGLLGADILRRYDIDINIAGGRLTLFFPQHDCSHPTAFMAGPLYEVGIETSMAPWLTPQVRKILDTSGTKFSRAYGPPTVNVTVGNQILRARVDTGAPSTVIFKPAFARLGLTEAEVTKHESGKIYGVGPRDAPAAGIVLTSLGIGDLELNNVTAILADQPVPFESPDMLIGLDTMKHIHFWISHTSGTLIMQYPPKPSPPLPPALEATPTQHA